MKEIGGYMSFENFSGEMLYGDGILLNTGRACLQYIIEARGIKKIALPYYNCEVVTEACEKYNVEIRYFSIDADWLPKNLNLREDEYLYIVDYYGQLTDSQILDLKQKYQRVILDETMAYFRKPFAGIDTIYSCRKFFGVADGGILFTDSKIARELPQDETFERLHYVMGRYERTASEFYKEYATADESFKKEPIKRMSKLTENILRAVDYDFVNARRKENFSFLHENLKAINPLNLRVVDGAFLYPLLLENGADVRKKMIQQKIYIRLLWANVLESCAPSTFEYNIAENVLPLPVDQRYNLDDMKYMLKILKDFI